MAHNGDARSACFETEIADLREREQDLTGLIENASLGMNCIDPDGLLVWANQPELDLLGYAREEYLGRHISEFHADPSVTKDLLHRLTRGEAVRNCDVRLRCKDGAFRHGLISFNARRTEGRLVHVLSVTRDITERKRYEQRLLTQYGLARLLAGSPALQDALPGLLELICKHLGWRAGLFWLYRDEDQLLRCAASWEEPGEHRGFVRASASSTFTPGSGLPGRVWKSKAPAWITDLRRDGNFPRVNLATKHGLLSGFAFPILFGSSVFGVIEFFSQEVRSPDRDLLETAASLGYQIGEFLERTRAQQRLAEREESYRVLTATAPDGIVTIDASGTILFVNAAAAEIFGYEIGELTGAPLARLIPERLRAHYQAAAAPYVQNGQRGLARKSTSLMGEHRDGYEIPVEVSMGEYKQAGRDVIVAIVRDVRERKRLDDKLRETAKLESLGVLAGGIAHDFNNLLTGILGNVSLALELIYDTNPAAELLREAAEASERAANLTNQLLDYAGKGRYVIELTDISAVVRQMSALVQTSVPKHVTIRLDLQQPLPPVEADVAQIRQLIMNLVINGAEAIPEDREGTVLVITRALEVTSEYLESLDIAGLQPGSYVMISVHDNGAGMDEDTKAKIFDPFFTTKYMGRGLGLAAALGIVHGHKGGLRVFSTPGRGTTFRIWLPVRFLRF